MSPKFLESLIDIVSEYDGILLDAFGVLRNADGLLPGAKDFLEHLHQSHKNFLIVTNGSKLPLEMMAEQYHEMGIGFIEPRHILSSGSLIDDWVKRSNLVGKTSVVIGPQVSKDFVERSGVRVVDWSSEFDAVILANQDDFNFPDDFEALLSRICQGIDAGIVPKLLLPNPDVVYPKKDRYLGFTVGAISLLLEEALRVRYPGSGYEFEKLGKPFAPIFEKAIHVLGTSNVLMVGDQLPTDIAGAVNAGVDSALILTGLTKSFDGEGSGVSPTYVVGALV